MRTRADIDIREARSDDWPAIWRIISPTIRAGETYALAPDMSEDEARAYWTGPDRRTFVAQASEAIVGTYYIRANNAGGGAHVCNCGYMTAAAAAGQGIARAMCAHSLEVARAMGYRAMQFNFVISVNVRAVRLWHDMGFVTVGVLPEAFAHPSKGYVDALVMSRRL